MAYLDPDFSPLPDGWKSKGLQDVVEIHNAKRQPLNGREREGRKGSHPYCGANGVVDYINDYRFDGEYVLIAEDGGYWGKHEPSSYIMRGKFWVNNHAHVVCAIPTETTNTFFSNIVNYLNIDPFIGGDARGKLTKAILTQLAIPLPPLPEQKKIAHILSTVQRAIDAQERIIQTTTELKKALMHKLFTEGLRHEPQRGTEIGPVPESWEVTRFDSFAVLQRGFDITKKEQRPGDYPVVSSGGIASYHDEAKVKGPGVVIGRKGSLGTVHYIPSDYWPHDTTLWIKDFKGNNPRFVAYLLETMRLKRFDTGAANPTLNRNIVHSEKIAIPPKEQQMEIGKALEAVESKIAIHKRRKLSFQDLFRALLHELMTAKTRAHRITLSDNNYE